jgi:hypothetical protein
MRLHGCSQAWPNFNHVTRQSCRHLLDIWRGTDGSDLVHATVLIDAETGCRVDLIPGRTTDPVGAWLRDHFGARSCALTGWGPLARQLAGRCPQQSRSAGGDTCGNFPARAASREVLEHSACGACP